jgi:hypothetical protein
LNGSEGSLGKVGGENERKSKKIEENCEKKVIKNACEVENLKV